MTWWQLALLGWGAIVAVTALACEAIADTQLARFRGDAYRAYQRTTSPFFPWPPRSHPAEVPT